jgi:hypothetical protein
MTFAYFISVGDSRVSPDRRAGHLYPDPPFGRVASKTPDFFAKWEVNKENHAVQK